MSKSVSECPKLWFLDTRIIGPVPPRRMRLETLILYFGYFLKTSEECMSYNVTCLEDREGVKEASKWFV